MTFDWQDFIVFGVVAYVVYRFVSSLFKRRGKAGPCSMGCECVSDIKRKLK